MYNVEKNKAIMKSISLILKKWLTTFNPVFIISICKHDTHSHYNDIN